MIILKIILVVLSAIAVVMLCNHLAQKKADRLTAEEPPTENEEEEGDVT